MKVSESRSRAAGVAEIEAKETRKTSNAHKNNFSGQLKKIERENYEERINQLVSKIIEQGEKLGKKVDIRELRTYKKLLSEFLEEAVSNSLKYSKERFLDRRGRHRVFAIIKKINVELEALTEEILKKEKDHIKILKRVEDIKGLVLDLYL